MIFEASRGTPALDRDADDPARMIDQPPARSDRRHRRPCLTLTRKMHEAATNHRIEERTAAVHLFGYAVKM
jgi:hypothetical protein